MSRQGRGNFQDRGNYQGGRRHDDYRARERSPRRDDYGSRSRRDNRSGGPAPHNDRYQTPRRYDQSQREPKGGPSSVSSTMDPPEKLNELPREAQVPQHGRQLQLPPIPRPQGKSGRPITVLVNHFAIQSLPNEPVYQYLVQFRMAKENQRRGQDKVSTYQQGRAMVKGSDLFGQYFIFDGVANGWSTDELLKVGDDRTAAVELENGAKIEIRITNEKKLNFGVLFEYLQTAKAGKATTNPDLEDCFKYLHNLFRHDPMSRYITRPNSTAFFRRDQGLCFPLASTGGILEALRGIYQSVAVGFGRLTLNIDISTAAFYVPNVPMIDVAKAFAGIGPQQNLSDPSVQQQLANGLSQLVGMFFCVKHLDTVKNSKHLRAQSISEGTARTTSFDIVDAKTGETSTTTVYRYFGDKYKINLQYPDLRLLVTRAGMFPLEVCYSAPGERYREALQGRETADFIKISTSPAYVRSSQIMDNVKRLAWHTQKIPYHHGLSVAPNMLEIPARQLPAPLPIYASGHERDNPPSTGAWNLRNKRFLQPRGYHAWGLCYFPGRQSINDGELQGFCRDLNTGIAQCGLKVPTGPPCFLKGNPAGDIASIMQELYTKTGNHHQQNPDILFVIMHDGMNPQIYKSIKQICETQLGVATQCMIAEKSVRGKGRQQYIANVALKVNVKLGGLNSKTDDAFFKKVKVMFVGADVSHPSPAERRKIPPSPSYAAMVGSYDRDTHLYSAVASAQESGKEEVSAIKGMFRTLLNRYKEKNGTLPESVVYWRDGLSDSQITEFLEGEMAALKAARDEHGKGSFKLTAIVCVKRHKTRLFPKSEKGDKNGNVLPGTCVEVSAKAGDVDMFISTAAALQGCVVPARYTRVYEEAPYTIDEICRMVMNGTFSYQRATRSVSQHPAAYYAHQVAERARLRLTRDQSGQVVLPDTHARLTYSMYWQ